MRLITPKPGVGRVRRGSLSTQARSGPVCYPYTSPCFLLGDKPRWAGRDYANMTFRGDRSPRMHSAEMAGVVWRFSDMAKMFYTLDEAAAKLGMSEEDVQSLAESGQLQEFRDREKLMFKVEQVDLLAGDADDIDDDITLADTTAGGIEPISLSSTGSGTSVSLENSGEGTGISIFEPEDGDAVDSNADTLVSGGGLGGSGFNMDAGASGSGLAQLAFEPDDTSLGGNLLDDLAADSQAGASFSGGSGIGDTALGGSVPGALFEGGTTESDFTPSAAPAMGMMAGAEAYDGASSGLFGGISLGMVLLLMVALAVMVLGMTGGSQALLGSVDQNMLYMIAGGGLAVVLIFGGIGWAMLRRS